MLTINNVRQTIKKLKNNNAPGTDLIQTELVKYAGPEHVKQPHQLMVSMRINKIVPEELNLSIMCPIHKKGDIMVCSNFRGISLLHIAYKIFSNILFNRLSSHVEGIIGDYHQGRSTTDQILTTCHP